MSTINIDLAADTILNVMIGQQDENEVREVVFDFSGWYTTYGSGTISLAIQRPKDEWPYEGTLTVDSTNHKATWEISETDTAYAGTGQIQLSYKVGDAKKKSVVYRFTCHKSLGALGSVVTPVQIQTFIDEVEEALQTMDGKLDDMEDEIADVKADLNKLSETGATKTFHDITWQNGYVDASGVINSSSLSGFAIVPLDAGEIVTIGTKNTNIAIISTTTETSLSVGDSVTPVKRTTSDDTFQNYEYTATSSVNVVLCVLLSNYEVNFFKKSNLVTESELSDVETDLEDNVNDLKNTISIAEDGFALSIQRNRADSGRTWGDTRIPSFCYEGQLVTIKNNGSTAINLNLKDANDATIQTVNVQSGVEKKLTVSTIPNYINVYADVYPINVEIKADSFSKFMNNRLYSVESVGATGLTDWVNGSFEGTNYPTFNERNTRLRLPQLLYVNVGDQLSIKVNGQVFGIGQWTYANGTWTMIRNDNSFTVDDTIINIDRESYIMVVVAKSNTSEQITPSEIALTVEYIPQFKTYIKGIEQKIENLSDSGKSINFGAFSEGGHIVSHRGEPYPENTLYAMKKCVEEKSKILEMDVAFTSDNVPVLLHDTTINRTGRNADGSVLSSTININSITYQQALEYDFGIYKGQQYAGIKIPKLQDVLIYLRQKNCCAILDILGHTYTEEQYTILHDLLVGTDMVTFSALNAYQAQLDIYAELYNDTPFNPTSTANNFATTQSAYNKYKDKCPLVIVSGYASNASDATFTYFSKANALGVITVLGMIDTVESIQNLFNEGCRMVYSDTIRETEID